MPLSTQRPLLEYRFVIPENEPPAVFIGARLCLSGSRLWGLIS